MKQASQTWGKVVLDLGWTIFFHPDANIRLPHTVQKRKNTQCKGVFIPLSQNKI